MSTVKTQCRSDNVTFKLFTNKCWGNLQIWRIRSPEHQKFFCSVNNLLVANRWTTYLSALSVCKKRKFDKMVYVGIHKMLIKSWWHDQLNNEITILLKKFVVAVLKRESIRNNENISLRTTMPFVFKFFFWFAI